MSKKKKEDEEPLMGDKMDMESKEVKKEEEPQFDCCCFKCCECCGCADQRLQSKGEKCCCCINI